MTLAAFQKHFGGEEACCAHLEAVRWPHGPVCPACGAVRPAGRLRRNPAFLQHRDCGHQWHGPSLDQGAALQVVHGHPRESAFAMRSPEVTERFRALGAQGI
jgi:hypothetical protein